MSAMDSLEQVHGQRDAFIERFLQSAAGAFNMLSIYMGDRLGLYCALADDGPATSRELASRTGTHERYIREWLEQQTVAGILEVEEENHGTDTRRFCLPAGHVEPLIDCGSLNYIVPLAQLLVGAIRPMPIANGWLSYLPHPRNFAEPAAHTHYEVLMSSFEPDAAERLLDLAERLERRLGAELGA